MWLLERGNGCYIVCTAVQCTEPAVSGCSCLYSLTGCYIVCTAVQCTERAVSGCSCLYSVTGCYIVCTAVQCTERAVSGCSRLYSVTGCYIILCVQLYSAQNVLLADVAVYSLTQLINMIYNAIYHCCF